jgi:hypothetical protein
VWDVKIEQNTTLNELSLDMMRILLKVPAAGWRKTGTPGACCAIGQGTNWQKMPFIIDHTPKYSRIRSAKPNGGW